MPSVRLSNRGSEMIASFEGFRSRPYRDAVGVPTVGFGSTRGVTMSSPPVTRAQALARLKREANATYGAAVDRLNREHRLGLNQNQFDALTSFVYNVGPGALSSSTGIGRALRAKQWQRAADELLEWDKAGGRRLEGLSRRRRAERELFLAPPPVAYTELERRNLARLGSKDQETRRRARERLTEQARRIQRAARGERDGWRKHDRGRRYQGIRRRLR